MTQKEDEKTDRPLLLAEIGRTHIPGAVNGRLETDFPAVEVNGPAGLVKTAINAFAANMKVISMIILPVFLPLELIKNYLIYNAGLQDNLALVLRIDRFIDALFGSLTTPALIYALITVFRTGNAPSIADSFRWGRRQWGRVFGNRWLAGMAILGGLLLLVVPGMIFAVWFIFVDAIVSVEGDGQRHVLRRSRELTKGRRWMLFFSGSMGFMLIFAAGMILGIPLAFVDHWILSFMVDCAIDLLYQILTIMFLLAYLHLVSAPNTGSPLQSPA